jgi:CheY-like chemotaxis protein
MCTAIDGEQALQMAREKLPDLILLDMLLPKMTGSDVLHALKKDSTTAEIPVILCTGFRRKMLRGCKQMEPSLFSRSLNLGWRRGRTRF